MTFTDQTVASPPYPGAQHPVPRPESADTSDAPIQRFVADWLQTHDFPLDYEIEADGIVTMSMSSDHENEVIDDLYATNNYEVFRSTLDRAVTWILAYDSCPPADLEALWLWVAARLPVSRQELVDELLQSVSTVGTAAGSISRSALSIGLMDALNAHDEVFVSFMVAAAQLRHDGLIGPTGEYRDGHPVMAITPAGEKALQDSPDDTYDDEAHLSEVREFAAEFPVLCAHLRLVECELLFYAVTALRDVHDEGVFNTRDLAERTTALMRRGVLRAEPGEADKELSDEAIDFVLARLTAAGWLEPEDEEQRAVDPQPSTASR